jgi:hypothetical protein
MSGDETDKPMIRVIITWRCIWGLIRHGEEIVTLSDGSILKFTWSWRSAKPIIAARHHGDGCYVEIIERLSR